jgi:hypothetical protein
MLHLLNLLKTMSDVDDQKTFLENLINIDFKVDPEKMKAD